MKDIKQLAVDPGATLRETISVIDRGVAQIALVVEGDERLIGIVTDGDIRRGLLRGMTLDARVSEVMKTDFQRVADSDEDIIATNLMRQHLIHQVPAVDEQGRVTRLHLIEQTLRAETRESPVVIMAGGKGKRLHPLTKDCPKPMLQVGGKPILEIILEQCINSGFGRFHISVNFLKEQIVDHFGDGSRWGVDIRYIEEKEPLGTCGALSLLGPLPDQPVLVMNGDVLTRVEFAQLMKYHDERAYAVTMCVREHITKIPFGVVAIDDETVSAIQEKPDISHFVNTGIYVLEPRIIKLLKHGEHCDMPHLLGRAMAAGEKVAAFPVHEYWLDIGKPDTLRQADGEWR